MSIDLSKVDFFNGLPEALLRQILESTSQHQILSGDVLMREGGESDSIFFVISGRFSVTISSRAQSLTHIGPGFPIGEISFFAGGARTATVTAIRDGVVLKLLKADFLAIVSAHPEVWLKITADLANRLSSTTHGNHKLDSDNPRTITICPAGDKPIPDSFYNDFESIFSHHGGCLFLRYEDCVRQFGKAVRVDSADVTHWLSKLETQYEKIYFFTDAVMSDWSAKVIRQADQVFLVGMHHNSQSASPVAINEIESLVMQLHQPAGIKLILLHQNTGKIAGTRGWLANRQVDTHHHIALNVGKDYKRLCRFASGHAIGLVASGGGAYSAAHIGLYQALSEAGIVFDMMGGSSGGGAIAAALAMGIEAQEISHLIEEIFVANKAMKQLTWPRYSILDHTVFDREIRDKYTDNDIADLWTNYFALSVNLVDGEKFLHRSGPIWEAVRATSSIPGLLPPLYTHDGKILIDGGVLDNVPLKSMKQLKTGPDVVLSFASKYNDDLKISYSALPGRGKLVRAMVNPFTKTKFPEAPGIGTVLMRSMVLNNSSFEESLTPDDLHIIPALPKGVGLIDWQSHKMITASAYADASRQLEVLQKNQDPALMKILSLLAA